MKNELRIGNYVNVPTQPTPVQIVCAIMPAHAGTSHTIEHLELGGYLMPYEFIEPIPLTEEWLVKLGFDGYSKYILGGGRIRIKFVRNGTRTQTSFKNVAIPRQIKYVHQLQNLYFALTGEELVCQ